MNVCLPAPTPNLYNGYTEWLEKISWPNGLARELPMENLGDMVVWNQQNNASTGALGGAYPWKSGQDELVAAVATAGKRDARYWKAWYWRLSRSQACIDGAYSYTFPSGTTIQFDAVLIPSAGGGSTSPSIMSVLGSAQYPGITLPMDLDPYGVPIGLGIWGTAYSEHRLVKWPSAMESVFKFNEEYQPQFYKYDTTKMPFDRRWVNPQRRPSKPSKSSADEAHSQDMTAPATLLIILAALRCKGDVFLQEHRVDEKVRSYNLDDRLRQPVRL